MATNWSISACTVDASRVRMRSTPDDARLFAMAVPFDVNSSVISCRSRCTETYHVMAASGMRTAARKTIILGSSPKRRRTGVMKAPYTEIAAAQSAMGTHRSSSTRVK
jgi:hypothetical protein